MRPTLAISALLLFCAPLALSAQAYRTRVKLPGFRDAIALDTVATEHQVRAPVEQVFKAAVAAFEKLRVPISTRDSSRGIVGNGTLVRMYSLAGAPLSRYLNCGSGMTGPNADTFRITMAVAVLLDAAPSGGTRFRVGMAAGSQDIQGNSKYPVPCGSTGVLEAQIAELIKSSAAASP